MRPSTFLRLLGLGLALAATPACRAVGGSALPGATSPPDLAGASGSASADPRVAALYARDFVVRARAGEALVAEGEAALGVLGAAADAERGTPGPSRVGPVLSAVLAEVPDDRLQAVHLASAAPAVRAAAATEIGRRDVWSAAPALIDRIADDDVRVRAASIAALRRLTNRLYDVDLGLSTAAAVEVAARERAWWRREGANRPTPRARGG